MSEAAQELVVDTPLADELERRGIHVHPGDRVRFELVREVGSIDGSADDAEPPERRSGWDAYVGRFNSPEPDLARRAKQIARAEMGR
jgi:hypothetical protein